MMSSLRIFMVWCLGGWLGAFSVLVAHAQQPAGDASRTVVGIVQNQDLRRVPQAAVQVKDQEGTVIVTAVANEAGEFTVDLPSQGTGIPSAPRWMSIGANISF